MIHFYTMTDSLSQLQLGDMAIYYSYKMPIAYRTKSHGLRIRKFGHSEVVDRDIEMITLNKIYISSDSEIFTYNLNDQMKREILSLAEKIALKGLNLC